MLDLRYIHYKNDRSAFIKNCEEHLSSPSLKDFTIIPLVIFPISAIFALNQRNCMMKWKIEYRDDQSGGELRTTYYFGTITKEEVINFFGLDRPDVHWYNVIQID